MSKQKERKFLGIWIPTSIWLRKDISPQEKIFLAEINSLDADERRCFRGNDNFGEFFGMKAKSAGRIIDKLVKMGLVIREIDPTQSNKRRRKLWVADGVMEPTGATPEMMKQPPPNGGGSHPRTGEAPYIDENTVENTERERSSSPLPDFEKLLKKIPETETGVVLRQRLEAKPFLSSGFVVWLIEQAVSRFEKKVDLSETELDDWAEQFEKFGEEIFTKAIKQISLSNNTKGNLPSIGEIVKKARQIIAEKRKGKIVKKSAEPAKTLAEKLKEMTPTELVEKIKKIKEFPKSFQGFLGDYEKELKSRKGKVAQ